MTGCRLGKTDVDWSDLARPHPSGGYVTPPGGTYCLVGFARLSSPSGAKLRSPNSLGLQTDFILSFLLYLLGRVVVQRETSLLYYLVL